MGESKWALRYTHGTQRVLMRLNSGSECWVDVATFGSYNEAERVLADLRQVEAGGET